MRQILQIHSILPGQKPDKQFSIPQRNNSIQQTQVQQVQKQLAGVNLNQSASRPRQSNGYESAKLSSYQGDSTYDPPPAQSQTNETNPPSKLLHSNPAPESTRDDKLRRKDSETQEEDEFHDAHS